MQPIAIVPRPSGSRAAADDDAGAQGDGDGGAPKDLRVRVAVSSENPVRRWWGSEVLGHTKDEVNTEYLDLGMAVLTDHDTGRHIGRFENWSLDDDRVLRGDAVFDPEDEAAVKAYGKIERGFLRFVSVGYSIERYTLVEEDEERGNSYRATRWTPAEMSFVAVPADTTVGVNRSSDGTLRRITIDVPEPARQARSNTVSAPNTAAPAAAPQVTEAEDRAQRLADLAMAYKREGDLVTWITSKRSVDEIRAELIAQRAANAAQPAVAEPAPAAVTGVHDRAADKPWNEFGEFLGAVVRAGKPHATPDARLMRAATGVSVESGSDGGFMIPPTFATAIQSRAGEIGQIWSRVRKVPVAGNTATISGVDETSRANGSRWGGVVVGRVGEGDTVTGGKPKFHKADLKLKKLMGLMYLSEESAEDAPVIASIGVDAFAEELVYVTENEVINGNGAGEMLGIFSSSAVVVQAKKASQAADTLVADNVTAMLSRLNPRSRRTAVWCVDQSVEQQLPLMTIGDQPVYIPQGSLKGSPDFGMLLGLPVLVGLEYFAKLGDQGDIALLDFSQYAAIEKGAKTSQSMHVRFIYDEQVLKFTTRNDGAPLWKSPLTPKNGGPTISPFITLAERA